MVIGQKIKNSLGILVISITLVITHQVIASMQSANYKIWLDTFGSGGGSNVSGGALQMNSSLTSPSGTMGTSNNFGEKSGFAPIENEPSIGFSVQGGELDFGQLSPASTAYSSHNFSAYTNSKFGYKIQVYGQPLHSATHVLTPIGSLAMASEPGTEQFGINLVENTIPAVGTNPFGGIGNVSDQFNFSNKFAYSDGAVVAYAPSFSYQTDFTTSVIVNISPHTPAGIYSTVLTYEFVPVF
jgi:hypothetical protein